MPDVNKIIADVTSIGKRSLKDLRTMVEAYEILVKEVDSTFKEEIRFQDGKSDGLEDFYALLVSIKKNKISIINAMTLIERLKNISDFNISEETIEKVHKEVKETKELEEILR